MREASYKAFKDEKIEVQRDKVSCYGGEQFPSYLTETKNLIQHSMLEFLFPLADSDGKERAYRMSKKDLLPASLQKPALLVSLRLGKLRSPSSLQ